MSQGQRSPETPGPTGLEARTSAAAGDPGDPHARGDAGDPGDRGDPRASEGMHGGARILRDRSDTEPRVLVLPDEAALAEEAARLVVAALGEAIAERGRADLVLTGGSSAVNLYRALGSVGDEALEWDRVHLWWGDERYVPYDHPESNTNLVTTTLLRLEAHAGLSGEGDSGTDVEGGRQPGVRIPADQVHPMPVAEGIRDAAGPERAAEQYETLLRAQGPRARDGIPAFDVVLLGVGPDGHILSVFPESPLVASDGPLVAAVPAPTHVEPHLPRVTLHPRVLDAARHVIAMVPRSDKAEVVSAVLTAPRDPRRWPAQLARRRTATWLLDEAAAARLERG